MKVLVGGLHAVLSLLETAPEQVADLWLQANRKDKRLERVRSLAATHRIAVQQVERAELDCMANEGGGEAIRHQGVLARANQAPARGEHDLMRYVESLEEPPFLLILDGVTDPHNLGACLRSADAAGVDAVIVPKDRAAGLTPVARKVASGAAETVAFFQVTNLARTLDQLADFGIWLVGAAGEAEQSIYEIDLDGPIGLVMGAEGSGMRKLTKQRCQVLTKIPMFGAVSSLNVSVATGVCLFEVRRQRLLRPV